MTDFLIVTIGTLATCALLWAVTALDAWRQHRNARRRIGL